jgi:hypothetical protein
MTILQDVKTTLDNYSGLSSLVSTRNYALMMPQSPTFPNVVFSRSNTLVDNDLDGLAKENPKLQIDCRATTYASARSIAEQVKLAMRNATLYKSILTNDTDFPYEDGAEVHRISLDFSVW